MKDKFNRASQLAGLYALYGTVVSLRLCFVSDTISIPNDDEPEEIIWQKSYTPSNVKKELVKELQARNIPVVVVSESEATIVLAALRDKDLYQVVQDILPTGCYDGISSYQRYPTSTYKAFQALLSPFRPDIRLVRQTMKNLEAMEQQGVTGPVAAQKNPCDPIRNQRKLS